MLGEAVEELAQQLDVVRAPGCGELTEDLASSCGHLAEQRAPLVGEQQLAAASIVGVALTDEVARGNLLIDQTAGCGWIHEHPLGDVTDARWLLRDALHRP